MARVSMLANVNIVIQQHISIVICVQKMSNNGVYMFSVPICNDVAVESGVEWHMAVNDLGHLFWRN